MSKDWLKQIVEAWIRFSIMGDKKRKETPKEWNNYLNKLYVWWNKQKKIWPKKWLPKTRKILPTHTEAWTKVYRDLYNPNDEDPLKEVLNLVKIGLANYIKHVKWLEDWPYGDHRFTLYKFIKQANGLREWASV